MILLRPTVPPLAEFHYLQHLARQIDRVLLGGTLVRLKRACRALQAAYVPGKERDLTAETFSELTQSEASGTWLVVGAGSIQAGADALRRHMAASWDPTKVVRIKDDGHAAGCRNQPDGTIHAVNEARIIAIYDICSNDGMWGLFRSMLASGSHTLVYQDPLSHGGCAIIRKIDSAPGRVHPAAVRLLPGMQDLPDAIPG
jgi:hypothetical protein